MSKFAWCTDIHLDHLHDDASLISFAEGLVATDPASILITGDISTAKNLVYHLSAIERVVQRPVFFVLGNHDYWGGDIDTVRKEMKDVCNMSQFLKYLPLSPYTPVSPTTAIVGHDGWYDAYYGDADKSQFVMNDWALIRDYVQFSGGGQFMNINRGVADKAGVISFSRKLAKQGVDHIAAGIKAAVRSYKNIVVLTHYPPFAETHMYQGKIGDVNSQPWYTSRQMGDMLLAAAKAYPNVHFNVLAGHTHGRYDGRILPNLEVHVADAAYGSPGLSGLIDIA